MIIVDPKQYRNRRSCSTRQVLPKIPQIYVKAPAPRLKTLFKKKSHRRCLSRESEETSKYTLYIERLQQRLSIIIKTNNIFCSTRRSTNRCKG